MTGTRMDADRERAARRSMRDSYDSGPAPRTLPAWNESVQAILALERLLNDGCQLSFERPQMPRLP